jgi:hypothetical protein
MHHPLNSGTHSQLLESGFLENITHSPGILLHSVSTKIYGAVIKISWTELKSRQRRKLLA